MPRYNDYAPMAAKWLLPDGTITDKMPISGGGGGVPGPESITTEMFAPDAKTPLAGTADNANAVTWGNVSGKPTTYAPATHQHNANDINAGTLSADRIPTLAQSKVTNLATDLGSKIDQSAVAALDPIADPTTATAEDIATAYNSLLAALQS